MNSKCFSFDILFIKAYRHCEPYTSKATYIAYNGLLYRIDVPYYSPTYFRYILKLHNLHRIVRLVGHRLSSFHFIYYFACAKYAHWCLSAMYGIFLLTTTPCVFLAHYSFHHPANCTNFGVFTFSFCFCVLLFGYTLGTQLQRWNKIPLRNRSFCMVNQNICEYVRSIVCVSEADVH